MNCDLINEMDRILNTLWGKSNLESIIESAKAATNMARSHSMDININNNDEKQGLSVCCFIIH